MVTVEVPFLLESALETAVTVTVACAGEGALGTFTGAVYRPLASIVPVPAFPPVTPFTCQVTPLLLAFDTVAVNCCVLLTTTLALPGVTDTDEGCDDGPPELDPDPDDELLLPPPPQPMDKAAIRRAEIRQTGFFSDLKVNMRALVGSILSLRMRRLHLEEKTPPEVVLCRAESPSPNHWKCVPCPARERERSRA
jgi:hypothetical protein